MTQSSTFSFNYDIITIHSFLWSNISKFDRNVMDNYATKLSTGILHSTLVRGIGFTSKQPSLISQSCTYSDGYMSHNHLYIHGLVQERRNSIANALELHLVLTHIYVTNGPQQLHVTDHYRDCQKAIWGLFYQHGLTLIPAFISNYIHYIIYPFTNFNCASLGMDKPLGCRHVSKFLADHLSKVVLSMK